METYDARESLTTTANACGDLIAQAAALALWPQQQLGWEQNDVDSSDNPVFASSISEIDGEECNIGEAGCRAIVEGFLAPRQSVGQYYMFNECLSELSLGGNNSLGDEGASAIAAALKPRSLPQLNKTLTVLNLSKCNIGPAAAEAIGNALRMIPRGDGSWVFPSNMRALNLSGNRIESKGARAITHLLGPKKNKRNGEWTFNP